jgi:hypothetical protein
MLHGLVPMVAMGTCFGDSSDRETGDEKRPRLYKSPIPPRPHTSIPAVLALQPDVVLTLGSHGGHGLFDDPTSILLTPNGLVAMVPMGAFFEDSSYCETGDEKRPSLYKGPNPPMAPRCVVSGVGHSRPIGPK